MFSSEVGQCGSSGLFYAPWNNDNYSTGCAAVCHRVWQLSDKSKANESLIWC